MVRFAQSFLAVICLIVVFQSDYIHASSAPSPSQTGSHYIRPASSNGPFRERVVVFVHGLFGDADTTWRSSSSAYWPALLLTDRLFDDSDIYVVNYHTQMFGSMTLEDIVSAINNQLIGDQVFSRSCFSVSQSWWNCCAAIVGQVS
jgi:hypothetical protein